MLSYCLRNTISSIRWIFQQSTLFAGACGDGQRKRSPTPGEPFLLEWNVLQSMCRVLWRLLSLLNCFNENDAKHDTFRLIEPKSRICLKFSLRYRYFSDHNSHQIRHRKRKPRGTRNRKPYTTRNSRSKTVYQGTFDIEKRIPSGIRDRQPFTSTKGISRSTTVSQREYHGEGKAKSCR